MFDAVLKHDLQTGSIQAHPFGYGRFGGEAVFAACRKKAPQLAVHANLSTTHSAPCQQTAYATVAAKAPVVFAAMKHVLGIGRESFARGNEHQKTQPDTHCQGNARQQGTALSGTASGDHTSCGVGSAEKDSPALAGHTVQAQAGDDGWLLVHVWDETTQSSECLVLDAADIEAPPVARILLPSRVPYGFHGIYVPHDDNSSSSR